MNKTDREAAPQVISKSVSRKVRQVAKRSNYYSLIGSGFIPGNSVYGIATFEMSTTFIDINSGGVKLGLPTANSVFDITTSKMWGAWGTSYGSQFEGLFLDATTKTGAGKLRELEN